MFGIPMYNVLAIVFGAGSIVMTVLYLKTVVPNLINTLNNVCTRIAVIEELVKQLPNQMTQIHELSKQLQAAENDISWIKDKLRSNQ